MQFLDIDKDQAPIKCKVQGSRCKVTSAEATSAKSKEQGEDVNTNVNVIAD